MSPDDLKRLESLGVDILDLPRVHDEASLFDFVSKVMSKFSTALGGPEPTYEQVLLAVKESRKNFDF
jgi:hypothetical protein